MSAAAGIFPWKAGEPLLAVAGVHLGDDQAQLDRTLGQPSNVEDLAPDSFAMQYRERGIVVLYTTHEGVNVIYLLSRDASGVDGVRVGDSRESALAKWGLPSSINGADAIYRAGDWQVAPQLGPGQQIVQLSVGRTLGGDVQ